MNHGVILSQPKPQNKFFGALTSIQPEILNPLRDWTPYLGVYEPQSFPWGDSEACVTYSAINCLEILAKFRTGQDYNWSRRFLAKEDGTTDQGNTMEKVADTIGAVGLVDEIVWPDDEATSFDDYYKFIPANVFSQAATWFDTFEYDWEWVGPSRATLLTALQTSPIQVIVQVGDPINASGFYTNGIGPYAHAVTLYAANDQFYSIYDHYTNDHKKYDASYQFEAAVRFFLKAKGTPMPNPLNLVDNTLIQLVEAPGGFGLFLGGKILVDDLAKILASFTVRNGGDIKGKVVAVTAAQWASYPHANLKGEPI